MIQDSLWIINQENYIVADTNFYHINELGFSNNKQGVWIDGKISENLTDTLLLGFQRFDLSNFDMFMKSMGIDPDGMINGNLKIIDFYNSPSFLSDIEISDFYFNKEKLGEAVLKTTWNPSDKAFNILGEIIYTGNVGKSKTFEMTGIYFPESIDENFDIDIKLNNYKLKTVEPFIRSFGSNIKGLASGNLKLKGTKEKPDLTGEINLMRSQITIDYINVKYFLADKIYFDQNLIHFDDVTIYDSLNNRVTCSGNIKHNYLNDFNLDLNFDANNIVGLNTTRAQNEVFYGNAMTSGNFRIHGPLDNIIMDISINSEKGTDIKIPVSYSVDVTENDYIIFKTEAKKDTSTQKDYDLDIKGVAANIDLNVNNDADIQLYLPYQMGNIRARGDGDIKMEITPTGKFTMDGEYVISKGYLFLTLQNIINRNFDIRRGGKVSWTGDPYNAIIDVKAVYKIKTTLGEYGPEEDSATRVPVDCVIGLSNNLYDPEIRFSIEFPDLKDDQKQYIYARLDTNDQAIMSQQMISLLVLNSFSSSTGNSGSLSFNTFSLLTNQLNSWLSQISNDFDIGVNYRPGDEISSQEVEVALSTQLFDERVLIDGNVGVRGSENAQKTNDLVGEVNVEVKITRDGRFRAKAFNKSNNNYLYRNYSPYTQGVGVFYTQDFYRFGDLFRKKIKNLKR